jgi:hypothetical protein
MVGRELFIAPGQPLVNDVLMGAVVFLILISCIFSAVITTNASKRISRLGVSDEEKQGEEDKMLMVLSKPETMANLVNLSLMMRPHRSTAPLIGVKLVVDVKGNERELDSARQLVKEAAQVAAAAGINMKKVVRSGINLITSLSYVLKDFEASEIITGYDTAGFGKSARYSHLLTDMLQRITRQIIIVCPTRTVNTIRCIHVIVPRDAELEMGFKRWLAHVSRLARQMDCRIIFYSTAEAWGLISTFCQRHYKTIRMSWTEFPDAMAFTSLSETVHDDHLLVFVSARIGSLSYRAEFQKVSELIVEHFPHCSKMLIFPDQYGIENRQVSFNTGFREE